MGKVTLTFFPCSRCPLSKGRRRQVVGKGCVPADLLFVGEGPGRSEDMVGKPFIGVSGRILRLIVKQARDTFIREYEIPNEDDVPSIYYTNCVQCRPVGADGENRAPMEDELFSCFFNFQEVYSQVRPLAVVCLGRVAERYLTRRLDARIYHIQHPAYIKRVGGEASTEFGSAVAAMVKIFHETHIMKRRAGIMLTPVKEKTDE